MGNVPGFVALEDGTVFTGESFGAQGIRSGEVVFNTSMTGYQEILTDPSYRGQIVTMTYPLIGNYGVRKADEESAGIRVEGFIVREYCNTPSNFSSEMTLSQYLSQNGVVAVSGIDTRKLTKHIRLAGAMRGVIAAGDHKAELLIEEARRAPGLVGRDLVKEVTCEKQYVWTEACPWREQRPIKHRVVAYDFGIKFNILRELVSFGCQVTVVPASTPAKDVLAMKPDGIFLSNGPGDPAGVPHIVEEVRQLVTSGVPVFGICLGQQLIGLAWGAKTYKLKFGHRGANHPVKDLKRGTVEITTQNHGFCVDMKTLCMDDIEITHMNLNDKTPEGLLHRKFPVFSVQYHPEAGAGPHDAEYHFQRFVDMMDKR